MFDNDDIEIPLGAKYSTLVKTIKNYGHVYALTAIFIFTVATRLQGYKILRQDGEWILLGNDSWYHFRATMFSVKNNLMPIGFDAKTGYPEGSNPGTFGTLYDFIHAVVSYVVGLGSPTVDTVRTVLVFSPPLISGLAVLSAYLLTKHITGSKYTGVFSSAVMALFPGTFYSRGVAGFSQHHMSEVLMILLVILAVMKTLQKAEDNIVLLEVVRNSSYAEVNGWLKLVALSSALMFIYYQIWPAAVMVFGLIGISGVLYAVTAYTNSSTQSAMLTYTVLTGVSVLIVLVSVPSLDYKIASPSLSHVGVTVSSFVFNLVFWQATRRANRDQWNYKKFLASVSGFSILSLVTVVAVQPKLIGFVFDQIIRLLGNPLGLGDAETQTIAEEASTSVTDLTLQQYGTMLPLAIFSILAIIGFSIFKRREDDPFAEYTLLVVVSVFIMAISLGTIRFNYYMAGFVAVLSAFMIYQIVSFIGTPDSTTQIESYHIATVALVIILALPVLVVPVDGVDPVYDQSINAGNAAGYQQWAEVVEWMPDNTPEDGVGLYEQVGPSYKYDNDSYGVMSWWDYGHWITVAGERTPVANPFQQNAEPASEYLLAQSPEEAESVMSELDSNATAKYVAIDWQMASPFSKLSAIEEWNPEFEPGDLYTGYYASKPGQPTRVQFFQRNQEYYNSMMGRLFVGHGSAMESSSTTIEYSTTQSIRLIQPATGPITRYNTTEEAINQSQSSTEVSRGGILGPPERVPALEQYRLVKSSPDRSYQTRVGLYETLNIAQSSNISRPEIVNDVPSIVKIFERVKGAEISGTGATPNSTFRLEIDVEDPVTEQGNEFTYHQRVESDEDGEFTAVVPYSNTGYNETENNPEVRGISQYRLLNDSSEVVAQFDVPEKNVKEDTDPITVDLSS